MPEAAGGHQQSRKLTLIIFKFKFKKMSEINNFDSVDEATIASTTPTVSSLLITAPAVEASAVMRLDSCMGNEDIIDPIRIHDVNTVNVTSAKPSKVSKRIDNVICWDEYFMAIAFLSSMRSKDPSTQVGACIVNEDKRIVGIGYNGFPRGCRSVTSYGCLSVSMSFLIGETTSMPSGHGPVHVIVSEPAW